MDAILLLLEAAAMILLLRWTFAARGESTLLGWRPPAPGRPARRSRR